KSQNSNLANIDEFILEQMEVFHVPGLSVVIIKGNSIVWNNNYGYMNLEDSIPVNNSTLFNVFSIGKSITAACVMQLWDKGLLGLDQNINDFLPFQIENPWNNSDSITARMLMSHTSSINNGSTSAYSIIGDPTIPLNYFMENYLCLGGEFYSNNNFYNAIPGTSYHYDNYGVAMNGFLVEPLTTLSFSQFAHDSLFTPLEMEQSTWFLGELNMDNLATGYVYSGGNFLPQLHYGHPAYPGLSLRTTALELSNFVIMLLNDGAYNEVNILSEAAVDSMAKIQNPAWYSTYGTTGLGLYRRTVLGDRIVWGHNGGTVGGYAAHFHYCKEENSGVVITTNSEQYVDPIAIQMFEYAGLMVFADISSQISDSSFYANWQSAPISSGYLLDVAEDENFINIVDDYENFDIGTDTMYAVNDLSSNTDYFYRLRAYNDYDTGAYSNTISLTTLLGTGLVNKLNTSIKVWLSNNVVYIELPQNTGLETSATLYSLTGQLLHKSILTDRMNSIRMDVGKQPMIIKVNAGNKSYCKKVMAW
ncbi:serine hydrolase, partial [Desulfosarcina sp.]|nr:serine hydrolase [Desulfosarcina sp.]